MPSTLAADIALGMLEAIAHAGLGGEVDDDLRRRRLDHGVVDRRHVLELSTIWARKPFDLAQHGMPLLLQPQS